MLAQYQCISVKEDRVRTGISDVCGIEPALCNPSAVASTVAKTGKEQS